MPTPTATNPKKPNRKLRPLMSFADLPPELVEALVDHLQDDDQALREVSMVARALYQRTRKYLFHSLDIGQRPGLEGRYGELKALLVSRPDLCGCIQELSIVLCDSDDDIVSPDFFPDILPLLSSIWALRISGRDEGVLWSELPEMVQRALEDLAFRPTITSLDLELVCDFPVSRLAHSTGLSRLNLTFVFPKDMDQNLPLVAPPSPTQSVENSDVEEPALAIFGESSFSLFLILQEAALYKITPPFVKPKHLLLGYPGDDQGLAIGWDTFINWCSSSIQTYEFCGGLSTPHFIRFTSFPNLREFRINIPAKSSDFWSIMTPFLEELAQCASSWTPSTLETMNFTITSIDGEGRQIEEDDVIYLLSTLSYHPCWHFMERCLASQAFPVLKMVRIAVQLNLPHEPHQEAIDDFLETVNRALQVLRWKNSLVVQLV